VQIETPETDAEIAACFSVMSQLRPHLDKGSFVARVRAQMGSGYALAALVDGHQVRAVAGYRLGENLAWGRFLYVDDLVTDAQWRGQGCGGRLMAWLIEQAREAGCDEVHLDSGLERLEAHRFYEGHGLEQASLHFRLRLQEL
jgi:GNAT superfamily N-acetyltransferase